jgi:predicted HD phosphohydrolase
LQSLALQGGPMTAEEAEAFLALPYARESLTVRRADDAAKAQELQVPQLVTYFPLVSNLWR